MRRKRLNHAANIFCDMFCGWRLMNSYEAIQKLGSGSLEIDVLTGECEFNGNEVNTLSIAIELREWFKEDLLNNNIDIKEMEKATLGVNLELSKTQATSAASGSFYIGKDGKPIEKGEFYSLRAECVSNIQTDEASYDFEKTHYEKWPVGWPNT